ncbi:hypothetical protein [Anabaena sp. CCY 9402-a]|uniref:hypothetical protein n=1 Tax=Anabaena sp. CCY 9402-a TaxID=3103867 RepID=UPI0039C65B6D
MARGGYREGAGRKKGSSNESVRKYSNTAKTKVVRVPVGFNELAAVSNLEQLVVLVETWQVQAEEAAKASKTGKTPRTFDYALQLLEELRAML